MGDRFVPRDATDLHAPNTHATHTHSPLLTFVQPADRAAVLRTFADALAATSFGATQGPAPHPRRLLLRLRDGEVVAAAFIPTDEEGTVMCTLVRRGASPFKG